MSQASNPFRGVKRFFLVYFALLILVLTFVGVMGWLGYEVVDASIVHVLFGLLLCSAVIAGGVFLSGRIMRGWLKVLVASGCTLLVLALCMVMMFLYSIMMFYSVPVHYTTLTSPAGADAVVLRRFSRDMEMAQLRRDVRIANDEAVNPDEYEFSDLGYEYLVYPEKLGFFYNTKAEAEGRLEISCLSDAQLMYEWTDDNTLHLYIENPETWDSGELELVLP